MSYYHSTREFAKDLCSSHKEAGRAASKRRTEALKEARDPSQSIHIIGRRVGLPVAAGTAQAPSDAALIPWNGHADTMIDRFDVRALLDIIPKGGFEDEIDHVVSGDAPVGTGDAACTEPDAHLERLLCYERYRGVLEAHRKAGAQASSEEALEASTVAEIFDQLALRALALASPAAENGSKGSEVGTNAPLPSAVAGEPGQYGRVGYMYDASQAPSSGDKEAGGLELPSKDVQTPKDPEDEGEEDDDDDALESLGLSDGEKDPVNDEAAKAEAQKQEAALEAVAKAYGVVSDNGVLSYDDLLKLERRAKEALRVQHANKVADLDLTRKDRQAQRKETSVAATTTSSYRDRDGRRDSSSRRSRHRERSRSRSPRDGRRRRSSSQSSSSDDDECSENEARQPEAVKFISSFETGGATGGKHDDSDSDDNEAGSGALASLPVLLKSFFPGSEPKNEAKTDNKDVRSRSPPRRSNVDRSRSRSPPYRGARDRSRSSPRRRVRDRSPSRSPRRNARGRSDRSRSPPGRHGRDRSRSPHRSGRSRSPRRDGYGNSSSSSSRAPPPRNRMDNRPAWMTAAEEKSASSSSSSSSTAKYTSTAMSDAAESTMDSKPPAGKRADRRASPDRARSETWSTSSSATATTKPEPSSSQPASAPVSRPAATASKAAIKGSGAAAPGKRKLTPAEKLAAKIAAGFGSVQTEDKARAAARDEADREDGRSAELRAKLRIEEGRRKARAEREKAGSAQNQVDSFLGVGN